MLLYYGNIIFHVSKWVQFCDLYFVLCYLIIFLTLHLSRNCNCTFLCTEYFMWALRKEREIHSSFGTFGFPKSHFSLLTSWSDHSGKGSLLGSSASVAVEALAPVTEEALDFLFIDPNAVIRTQMTHWRSYLTFVKWLLSRKSTLTQIKSRRYSITITNVQDQGRGSRNYHNN